MKLVWNKAPTVGNGRNSEGSFIRLPDGGIFFAYSRYNSSENEDNAGCDIAAIVSYDEGETWSEPRIIVPAAYFGVKNVMSVSAIYQQDGKVGIYFLIKENEGNNTFGRALSADGLEFSLERCEIKFQKSYYVMNNDRLIRLADGRLCAPVAVHGYNPFDSFAYDVVLISEDDGATFSAAPARLSVSATKDCKAGMQEPGVYEHEDGTIRLWARTSRGSQYESFSRNGFLSATDPMPSIFTSPNSPMELAKDPYTGTLYAVYNPVPGYLPSSRDYRGVSMGRTPLVLRKSLDDGKTWERFQVIEDDPDRGYCYPALFFTKDDAILCAYCRGNADDGICLARLGIMKIVKSEIV